MLCCRGAIATRSVQALPRAFFCAFLLDLHREHALAIYRRLILTILTVVGLSVAVGVSPAAALAPNCNYDFCLYCNSGAYGYNASHAHYLSAPLGTFIFDVHNGNDAGYGQAEKNNSGAARNISGCIWRVFYFSNYTGPSDRFNPGTYGDLYNTKNEDASVQRDPMTCP